MDADILIRLDRLENAVRKLCEAVENIANAMIAKTPDDRAAQETPLLVAPVPIRRNRDGTFDKDGWIPGWVPELYHLWQGKPVEYMRDDWSRPGRGPIPPEANIIGLWVRVIWGGSP